MNWPATMISQVQNMAGPPRPKPTPKLPNDPVETLMKLNASAKFARNPSDRFSCGLMPSDSQVRIVARRDVLGRFTLSRHGSPPYHRTAGASCPLG